MRSVESYTNIEHYGICGIEHKSMSITKILLLIVLLNNNLTLNYFV